VAADGHAALDQAAAHPLDVALVDVRMPGPSGITLAEQLKKQHLMEVIIMTAYGSIAHAAEAMQRGVFFYLTKPIKLALLRTKLKQALLACRARYRVQVGELAVDLRDGQATLGGQPLSLTGLESRLLICLASRRGRLVTHEILCREVWGFRG
jgi:DNA-binding response OmpR family regulator